MCALRAQDQMDILALRTDVCEHLRDLDVASLDFH